MKLFQFAQMFPTVPKFEWGCFFKYPNMIKAVGICTWRDLNKTCGTSQYWVWTEKCDRSFEIRSC